MLPPQSNRVLDPLNDQGYSSLVSTLDLGSHLLWGSRIPSFQNFQDRINLFWGERSQLADPEAHLIRLVDIVTDFRHLSFPLS
jgi:hypothetical protein